MAQQNQPQPVMLRLEFPTEPELVGNDYSQRVVAIATKGSTAIQVGVIQFELDGMIFGSPTPLNAIGKAVKDVPGLKVGKIYVFGASLIGTASSVSEPRAITKTTTAKPDEETECRILPSVFDDRVVIVISVASKSGKDIANVPVDFYISSNVHGSGHYQDKTDAHGDCRREFGLDPKEKKEITILVTGFPDGEFRRTFKGY